MSQTPNQRRLLAKVNQELSDTETILSSIGDGVMIIDANARLQKVNSVAVELLQLKPDEIIGEWFPSIVEARDKHGKPIALINRPITRALMSGKTVAERAYYVRKDGSLLPVSITVSPLMHNDKPIGAIEVFRDITRDVELDKMKDEFLSLASHQLRTPLSAIKIYAQMLAEGYGGRTTRKQQEFLEIVINSTNRMNELIDTLLDVTRLEAGKIVVRSKAVKLDEILKELYLELRPAAEQKHITFKLKSSVAKTVTDPLLVREIYANLISNAIKYTQANGQITTTLRARSRDYLFEITDTGYGIPAAVQKQIFTKFFRSPNVMQFDAEGTGLGLYMVQRLTNLLHGKLWFKSVEGQGSTFFLALPKRATTNSKTSRAPTATRQPAGRVQ